MRIPRSVGTAIGAAVVVTAAALTTILLVQPPRKVVPPLAMDGGLGGGVELRVRSHPAGAQVYVGGHLVGTTPFVLHLDGPRDSVTARFVLEGYNELEQTFHLGRVGPGEALDWMVVLGRSQGKEVIHEVRSPPADAGSGKRVKRVKRVMPKPPSRRRGGKVEGPGSRGRATAKGAARVGRARTRRSAHVGRPGPSPKPTMAPMHPKRVEPTSDPRHARVGAPSPAPPSPPERARPAAVDIEVVDDGSGPGAIQVEVVDEPEPIGARPPSPEQAPGEPEIPVVE